MQQLILHLIGDYLLQNDWMAQNKKKKGANGFIACVTHCTLYSFPFLFLCSWRAVLVIFSTHFLIDRWFFIKWYMNTMGQKDFA